MIVRTNDGHNVELRSEWGREDVIPRPGYRWVSNSGLLLDRDATLGLPAVSNVIRSPAEIVASLPFIVYTAADPTVRARDSWQWELLHEKPNDYSDAYEFFYDLSLSLEAAQNAFVLKAKTRSRVVALSVLDPQRMRAYWSDEGEKLFDYVRPDGTRTKGLTTEQILHVRGFTPRAGAAGGTSLLEWHRNALAVSQAQLQFEGDYFKNNAQPPLWFTGLANKQQAEDVMAMHESRHAGPGNQWRVGATWGNADVKSLPISLADAMYAEVKRFSIEDACRIWRWPKEMLELAEGGGTPADEGQFTSRLLKFYLLPRLRRIESAFKADPDVFWHQPVFGEFLTAGLERADFVTRVRGWKDARQGGWVTANEIRERENLPARPDGDELLQTPTGSAPNRMLRFAEEPEVELLEWEID